MIKSDQKALADEMEDAFWPILSGKVSEWHIETVWSRLHAIFYAMADQNHILECCTDEIDPRYLQFKQELFARRYEKLLSRADCGLPPYLAIEQKINSLIIRAIKSFVDIARVHESEFSEYIDTIKATSDSQEVRDVIDKIAERDTAWRGQ